METGMRGFLLSGEEVYLAPYEQARGKFRPQTEQLVDLVSDNPPQVQRLERLLAMQEQWDLYAQEVIGSRREGGNFMADVGRGRGKNLTDGMRRELDTFINSERELRQQRNAEVSSTTLWGAGIYLVVSILFSALLALFGRRELLNLSQTYSRAMARQTEYADEQQRRAWLGGGQTLLAERLLGQPQVQELADRTLEFFAEYLDCMVAALYLRDASTGDLKRVAGYGFSEDASLKEHFYRGEGLIGQAARSRRLVCLDNLPADYIKVASSLGEGQPVSVALAPLQFENSVNGVVELAFMRALEPREREFLEAITSSVGTALEAARYRQRLQEVLDEPSSSTRNCRPSRRNCAPPTRNWSSRPACSRSPRLTWRPSRPSWSRPTRSSPSRPRSSPTSATSWISAIPPSVASRRSWRSVPRSCSAPVATSPSSSPT
jgi:hypothetical protein